MWLILCEPYDRAAIWVYQRLRARGDVPTELVTPAQLVYAPRTKHWIASDDAGLEIVLADGRRIASSEVTGVLNRMVHLPTDHLGAVQQSDRAYAMEELSALVVSWLACLRNVINEPHPLGIGGHDRHPTEWARLSRDAGFRLGHLRAGAGSMCLVLDNEIFGPPTPPRSARACARLAAMSDTRLLGVLLDATSGDFVAATPLPDLRVGGPPLLDALSGRWSKTT